MPRSRDNSNQLNQLCNSVHADGLHEKLVPLGNICKTTKEGVFSRSKALVTSLSNFTISEIDLIVVSHFNSLSKPYEFSARRPDISYHTNVSNDINLWHRHVTHTNCKILDSLIDHCSEISHIKRNLSTCHPCEIGKADHKSFETSFSQANHQR